MSALEIIAVVLLVWTVASFAVGVLLGGIIAAMGEPTGDPE